MEKLEVLRDQLERLLDWEDAHVGFDAVIVAPKVEATSSRFFCLPNTARSRVYVLV